MCLNIFKLTINKYHLIFINSHRYLLIVRDFWNKNFIISGAIEKIVYEGAQCAFINIHLYITRIRISDLIRGRSGADRRWRIKIHKIE